MEKIEQMMYDVIAWGLIFAFTVAVALYVLTASERRERRRALEHDEAWRERERAHRRKYGLEDD